MVDFTIELVNSAQSVIDEGNSGTTTVRFKIVRTGNFDPTKEYRVQVQLPQPQQTDPYDFTKLTPLGTQGLPEVQFRGSESEQFIELSFIGDRLVETNEIVRVTAAGYQAYDLDGTKSTEQGQIGAQAIVVIRNDDTAATHMIDNRQVTLAQQLGEAGAFVRDNSFPKSDAALAAEAQADATAEIEAAKADGELTAAEKKALEDAFNGYGFDGALADDIKKGALDVTARAIAEAVEDGDLTEEEKADIRSKADGLGYDEDVEDALDQAAAALANASFDNADLYFVLSYPGATEVRIGDAGVDVALMGRSVEDIASVEEASGIFTVTLRDEQVLLLNEIEYLQLADGVITLDSEKNIPIFEPGELALVASTYQFFTGGIPTAGGFEFLISSPDNETDLNDPYYAIFNEENLYINFANNLGSVGAGRETFVSRFGSLSFDETVAAAYDLIIGIEEAQAAGIDVTAALAFLRAARPFYEAVALQRVVSAEVPLDQAVKIVAIGSILHEAIKAGTGRYADAVETFVGDVLADGESASIGEDLFAVA